jgi:hypothetical protein
MKSTIYSDDRIDNQFHEFGESNGPRYWVMFIDKDGDETPLAFSSKDIADAAERGSKEIRDKQIFLEAYKWSKFVKDAVYIVLLPILFALSACSMLRFFGSN